MGRKQTVGYWAKPKTTNAVALENDAVPRCPMQFGDAPTVALRGLVITASLSLAPNQAFATSDPATICERAAVYAASETGVPVSVLKAITLTETGRGAGSDAKPWPWTVNMEGKGFWFETADAARAYANEHFTRGARSFDVGCFQINYKWHHEAFSSIAEMFDPVANALYAAQFLNDLHTELGDWASAAGAYHSRTPEHANRYKARFAEFRALYVTEDGLPLTVALFDALPDRSAGAPGAASPVLASQPGPRVNSYPLLQSGGATALGSLVPLSASGTGASLLRPGGAG